MEDSSYSQKVASSNCGCKDHNPIIDFLLFFSLIPSSVFIFSVVCFFVFNFFCPFFVVPLPFSFHPCTLCFLLFLLFGSLSLSCPFFCAKLGCLNQGPIYTNPFLHENGCLALFSALCSHQSNQIVWKSSMPSMDPGCMFLDDIAITFQMTGFSSLQTMLLQEP